MELARGAMDRLLCYDKLAESAAQGTSSTAAAAQPVPEGQWPGSECHVPAWVWALPHCSLMCHQFVTHGHRGLWSSSFLPSFLPSAASEHVALSLCVWGGKIALPYRSCAGNPQNTPRRGESRLRKCQVPLARCFQIRSCTVLTQPSPHRLWEPCHQFVSPVCLLTELSRVQEKLILFCLSWAV